MENNDKELGYLLKISSLEGEIEDLKVDKKDLEDIINKVHDLIGQFDDEEIDECELIDSIRETI